MTLRGIIGNQKSRLGWPPLALGMAVSFLHLKNWTSSFFNLFPEEVTSLPAANKESFFHGPRTLFSFIELSWTIKKIRGANSRRQDGYWDGTCCATDREPQRRAMKVIRSNVLGDSRDMEARTLPVPWERSPSLKTVCSFGEDKTTTTQRLWCPETRHGDKGGSRCPVNVRSSELRALPTLHKLKWQIGPQPEDCCFALWPCSSPSASLKASVMG